MDSRPLYALRAVPGYYSSKPGIQIGTRVYSSYNDRDLQFMQQLGVEWVMLGVSEPPERQTLERYQELRERLHRFGLKIYKLDNPFAHNMEEVTLNLPGRDEKIEQFLDFIRILPQVGVHYFTYAHMGNGIWSSGSATARGGARGRRLDLSRARGNWLGKTYKGPLTHGRAYGEDELWENYAYFIKKVVPVAEKAGVYIGMHPDDPPVYPMGGVPRCILGSMAGYKRALEIAGSPNIGVCLCVGCWLEGGPQGMGCDVFEAIRTFAAMGKLFKVHFRNVSAIMPAPWHETFLDDGYMNMHRVMRTLHEVGFDGVAIPDHNLQVIGGYRVAEAYSVGYTRALVQAVEDEG